MASRLRCPIRYQELNTHTAPGGTTRGAGSTGPRVDQATQIVEAAQTILDGSFGEPRVEPAPFEIRFVRVPYDIDAEVAEAQRVRMPRTDVWEIELRTAVYRGRQA